MFLGQSFVFLFEIPYIIDIHFFFLDVFFFHMFFGLCKKKQTRVWPPGLLGILHVTPCRGGRTPKK